MTLSTTCFFLPLEVLIWLRDSLSPVKANKAPSFLILIISPLLSEMKTDDLDVLTTIPSERVSPWSVDDWVYVEGGKAEEEAEKEFKQNYADYFREHSGNLDKSKVSIIRPDREVYSADDYLQPQQSLIFFHLKFLKLFSFCHFH